MMLKSAQPPWTAASRRHMTNQDRHALPTRRSCLRLPTKIAMFVGLLASILLLTTSALQLEQAILPGFFKHNELGTKEEIPGNSPIETCLDDEDQTLSIDSVVIDPNPPLPGANLTISAEGTLNTDLVDGSYVDVLVRYGFITLVNRRYDLCELLPEVDLECPLKAGFLSLTRQVELPENVPPGQYYVDAKAYNPDDSLITCLSAVVEIEA